MAIAGVSNDLSSYFMTFQHDMTGRFASIGYAYTISSLFCHPLRIPDRRLRIPPQYPEHAYEDASRRRKAGGTDPVILPCRSFL